MNKPNFKLIERLFAEHAGALQQFFRRRLRRRWDAPDMVHEVYTRMLRRINEPTGIDNPEAYLFTVASNLLRERAVSERKQEESRVTLSDPLVMSELTLESPPSNCWGSTAAIGESKPRKWTCFSEDATTPGSSISSSIT